MSGMKVCPTCGGDYAPDSTPTEREAECDGSFICSAAVHEADCYAPHTTEREAGDAEVAAVLVVHSIAGAHKPRQGAGQTIPELQILCLACGWMRASDYSAHLAPLIAEREAKAWEQGAKAGHHSPLTWFALRQVNPYRAALAPETREGQP